ncbi:MAG: hypothetical protein U1E51_06690 [Candidatus Binatia bacterium]|nr:hypothetical protein [Candidatus Binatia bacterium]
MKNLFLLFTLILSAAFANAQTSAFIGAKFDGAYTPATAGSVGILKPIDDAHKTFWYSEFTMRGSAPGNATVTPKTGIARLLGCQGIACLYTDAQAMGVVGQDASSGGVSGGGFGTVKLRGRYSLIFSAHGQKAPAAGGLKGVYGAGLLITP